MHLNAVLDLAQVIMPLTLDIMHNFLQNGTIRIIYDYLIVMLKKDKQYGEIDKTSRTAGTILDCASSCDQSLQL